jgi:hypothetical protein
MKLSKIENEPSFMLDETSGAFINVDNELLAERLNRKRVKDDMKQMRKEITELRNELFFIKKQLNLD